MGKGKRGITLNVKTIFRNIIVLAFIAVLLFGLANVLRGQLVRYKTELALSTTGSLQESIPLSGFVLFEETVVYSDHPGFFSATLQEGEKIAAGQVGGLLELSVTDLVVDNRMEEVSAPSPGIISYVFDDFENILSPSSVYSLNLSSLAERLAAYESRSTAETTVTRGDPLFRVVDNRLPPSYLAVVPADYFAALPQVDEVYQLTLPQGGACEGTVELVREENGQVYLLLSLAGADGNVYKKRFQDGILVVDTYEGVKVAAAALIEKDGVTGVYGNDGGVLRFYPVDVIKIEGEEALVQGLAAGAYYVLNPRFCKEGQLLA